MGSALAVLEDDLSRLGGDGASRSDLARFRSLFARYCALRDEGSWAAASWGRLEAPGDECLRSYESLPGDSAPQEGDLARLAVLKLNGGLGTTMGCEGPKSAIAVRDGASFLDLAVRHVASLNASGARVPLVLMNSFSTEAETIAGLQKHGDAVPVVAFRQAQCPRISAATLRPVDGTDAWYPPGHGDVYASLRASGVLSALLAAGRDVLFVSNIDNLGASADGRILAAMCAPDAPDFAMEVTARTAADTKGGTLVSLDGRLRLLELPAVPTEHAAAFADPQRFRVFNTNSLWVNLRALDRVLDACGTDGLPLDVFANPKTLADGTPVLQLETAAGGAIALFERAAAIRVPRSRFLPVKTCADLLLVRSNAFRLSDGGGTLAPAISPAPTVRLGEHFRRVSDFEMRVRGPPDVAGLTHLSVCGDVRLGAGVVLRGSVAIATDDRIDLPDGSVLHNVAVTGSLRLRAI